MLVSMSIIAVYLFDFFHPEQGMPIVLWIFLALLGAHRIILLEVAQHSHPHSHPHPTEVLKEKEK